jgi:hypothetical protein
MAVYGEGYHVGFLLAGADMSTTASLAGLSGSGQFLAMKQSTAADNTALPCATGNERTIGVLQNRPKSGQACDIQQAGFTKAMYGGTVTRGDLLEIDSSGRFVTSSTTGHLVVGQASESGALSEIHTINLFPGAPFLHP